MNLFDTVMLDGVRRTRDGYLVADAKVGRTGIQTYQGSEIGRPDLASVRVYRPESAVFATDALASAAWRPITIDHPNEMVTADNWKKHAVGLTGDHIARDGAFIRVPLTLMDAQAIAAVESGKRELSLGYTCELEFKDGLTPTGEAYDAIQSAIRINHLAICSTARGGPDLRIGDQEERPPNGGPTVALKTIIVDGLPVETTDAGEAAVNKLRGLLDAAVTAKDASAAEVVKLTAEAVAKDAEIVKLKDDLEKSKVTPAQMRDAAKAYAKTVALAKQLGATITDEMDEAAIKRAVVTAKMGDSTKAYPDEHVSIAFDTLTAGLKVDDNQIDPLRRTISEGPINVGDAEAAYRESQAKAAEQRRNAWKTPAAA
jgi:hypothetical protein